MEHLTDDQLLKVKEIFAIYDPDGYGFVPIDNLGIMLRQLGVNPTLQEMKDVQNQAELIGRNNKVDFPEFFDLVAHNFCLGNDLSHSLRSAFQVFDPKKTGRISASELRYALTTLGETLSNDQVDNVMADIEPIEDGKDLDYELLIARISKYG